MGDIARCSRFCFCRGDTASCEYGVPPSIFDSYKTIYVDGKVVKEESTLPTLIEKDTLPPSLEDTTPSSPAKMWGEIFVSTPMDGSGTTSGVDGANTLFTDVTTYPLTKGDLVTNFYQGGKRTFFSYHLMYKHPKDDNYPLKNPRRSHRLTKRKHPILSSLPNFQIIVLAFFTMSSPICKLVRGRWMCEEGEW